MQDKILLDHYKKYFFLFNDLIKPKTVQLGVKKRKQGINALDAISTLHGFTQNKTIQDLFLAYQKLFPGTNIFNNL